MSTMEGSVKDQVRALLDRLPDDCTFADVQRGIAVMMWPKSADGSLAPPKHILNAPTKLMGEQGYGEGYRYDHDAPDGFSGQDYFPEIMGRRQFYDPPERGFERDIRKRLAYWDGLRKKRGGMP